MILAYLPDEYILLKDNRYPGTSNTLAEAFINAGTGVIEIGASIIDGKVALKFTYSHKLATDERWHSTHFNGLELPDDLTYEQFMSTYPELVI